MLKKNLKLYIRAFKLYPCFEKGITFVQKIVEL